METVNQEEKTFTQAELDKIVQERLARDRARYADYDELKAKAEEFGKFEETKNELQRKTAELQTELDGMKKQESIRLMREKVAKETNIPANLLTGETEDECKMQAQNILDFAKPSYPNVRDGGETHTVMNQSTRQQFADWFNQLSN